MVTLPPTMLPHREVRKSCRCKASFSVLLHWTFPQVRASVREELKGKVRISSEAVSWLFGIY